MANTNKLTSSSLFLMSCCTSSSSSAATVAVMFQPSCNILRPNKTKSSTETQRVMWVGINWMKTIPNTALSTVMRASAEIAPANTVSRGYFYKRKMCGRSTADKMKRVDDMNLPCWESQQWKKSCHLIKDIFKKNSLTFKKVSSNFNSSQKFVEVVTSFLQQSLLTDFADHYNTETRDEGMNESWTKQFYQLAASSQ